MLCASGTVGGLGGKCGDRDGDGDGGDGGGEGVVDSCFNRHGFNRSKHGFTAQTCKSPTQIAMAIKTIGATIQKMRRA